MPRRKFKDTKLLSEKERKAIFDNKTSSLFKKAHELSVLCDVQLGIVIYSPRETILWPSEDKARKIVERYSNVPVVERIKKLVKNETYLNDVLEEREKSIREMEQKNEEKRMELLFNEFMEGKSIYEFDVVELKGIMNLFAVKMAKVEERKKKLYEEDNQAIEGNDKNTGKKNDGHPKN